MKNNASILERRTSELVIIVPRRVFGLQGFGLLDVERWSGDRSWSTE